MNCVVFLKTVNRLLVSELEYPDKAVVGSCLRVSAVRIGTNKGYALVEC
jgi:hypothetical protein